MTFKSRIVIVCGQEKICISLCRTYSMGLAQADHGQGSPEKGMSALLSFRCCRDFGVFNVLALKSLVLRTIIPLIRKAAVAEPLIISTGMAYIDLERAIDQLVMLVVRSCAVFVAFQLAKTTNIRTISHLGSFGVQVGLSDHTMGVGVSVAAVALGATVVLSPYPCRWWCCYFFLRAP